MKHASEPVQARLISRPNRFLGIVELERKKVECFIPNPGRMYELMIPGTRVYLIKRTGNKRKTDYDLIMVDYKGTLISIDSRLPNYILREAITKIKLPEFKNYWIDKVEPTFQDSRLDFKLCNKLNQILIEAKSCTLVENGVALFPDAPTKRGARHMNTLINALEYGRAAVCFIIQRDDAEEWRPYEERDPKFAQNIKKAIKKGVEAYAYTCKVSLEGVTLSKRISINLD